MTALNAILRDFVSTHTLRHPLLGVRSYLPRFNDVYNREYRNKREMLRQAVAAGNWHNVVWLHEPPFRPQALQDYANRMPDEDYWRLVGEVWIDSQRTRGDRQRWLHLWSSRRPRRDQVMTVTEHRLLANLPDTKLAIYRGFGSPGDLQGLSWTFNPDSAALFAQKGREPAVAFATVRKRHIQAFFSGRRPGRLDEVVVLWRHLQIVRIDPLSSPDALTATLQTQSA